VDATGLRLTDLTALDRQKFELLVVTIRDFPWELACASIARFLRRLRHHDVRVQATEIREGLGCMYPIMHWTRRAGGLKSTHR
jgi:hypothetical protein